MSNNVIYEQGYMNVAGISIPGLIAQPTSAGGESLIKDAPNNIFKGINSPSPGLTVTGNTNTIDLTVNISSSETGVLAIGTTGDYIEVQPVLLNDNGAGANEASFIETASTNKLRILTSNDSTLTIDDSTTPGEVNVIARDATTSLTGVLKQPTDDTGLTSPSATSLINDASNNQFKVLDSSDNTLSFDDTTTPGVIDITARSATTSLEGVIKQPTDDTGLTSPPGISIIEDASNNTFRVLASNDSSIQIDDTTPGVVNIQIAEATTTVEGLMLEPTIVGAGVSNIYNADQNQWKSLTNSGAGLTVTGNTDTVDFSVNISSSETGVIAIGTTGDYIEVQPVLLNDNGAGANEASFIETASTNKLRILTSNNSTLTIDDSSTPGEVDVIARSATTSLEGVIKQPTDDTGLTSPAATSLINDASNNQFKVLDSTDNTISFDDTTTPGVIDITARSATTSLEGVQKSPTSAGGQSLIKTAGDNIFFGLGTDATYKGITYTSNTNTNDLRLNIGTEETGLMVLNYAGPDADFVYINPVTPNEQTTPSGNEVSLLNNASNNQFRTLGSTDNSITFNGVTAGVIDISANAEKYLAVTKTATDLVNNLFVSEGAKYNIYNITNNEATNAEISLLLPDPNASPSSSQIQIGHKLKLSVNKASVNNIIFKFSSGGGLYRVLVGQTIEVVAVSAANPWYLISDESEFYGPNLDNIVSGYLKNIIDPTQQQNVIIKPISSSSANDTSFCTIIGGFAGQDPQGDSVTAFGNLACSSMANTGSIGVGQNAARYRAGVYSVSVGANSNRNGADVADSGNYGVFVGVDAGNSPAANDPDLVCIGRGAGCGTALLEQPGDSSVSIGKNSRIQSGADFGVSIGVNSRIDSDGGVAIGCSSSALGANTVALGGRNLVSVGAQATAEKCIAISSSATASGLYGISIGAGCQATTGAGNISIGLSAHSTGAQSIAIGSAQNLIANGARSEGTGSLAICREAYCTGDYNIAIGDNSTANLAGQFSIGRNVESTTANSIQITPDNIGTNASQFIIGAGNTLSAIGGNLFLVGVDNTAKANSFCVGHDNTLSQATTQSFAVGYGNNDGNFDSPIMVGTNNTSTGQQNLILGRDNSAGSYSVVCGLDNTVDDNVVCCGRGNDTGVTGASDYSQIVGYNNSTYGQYHNVVGTNNSGSMASSILLGSNCVGKTNSTIISPPSVVPSPGAETNNTNLLLRNGGFMSCLTTKIFSTSSDNFTVDQPYWFTPLFIVCHNISATTAQTFDLDVGVGSATTRYYSNTGLTLATKSYRKIAIADGEYKYSESTDDLRIATANHTGDASIFFTIYGTSIST